MSSIWLLRYPILIVTFILVQGKYREIQPEVDGLLRSRVFPGLWLDPEALWNCNYSALAVVIQKGTATSEHAEFVASLAGSKK